jgi:hypothetical protein
MIVPALPSTAYRISVRQHGPTHTIGTHLSGDYAADHLHEQADGHSWLAEQAEKLAKVLRQTVGLVKRSEVTTSGHLRPSLNVEKALSHSRGGSEMSAGKSAKAAGVLYEPTQSRTASLVHRTAPAFITSRCR